MRILIVAMVNSIHTARWLSQFDGDKEIEILLFPSTFGGIKDELKHWKKLCSSFAGYLPFKRAVAVHFPIRKLNSAYHFLLKYIHGDKWRAQWLASIIRKTKPDIVHTLEFQHAGYTCLETRKILGKDFPTWIATNWGSDVYLFSQLKDHKLAIKGILESADFYSAECKRDYDLARQLGLRGKELPVIPNSGGMHLETLSDLRSRLKPSQRNMLLIKGYQTIFGRALTALRAIESISTELKQLNSKICIFLATPDVEVAAELTANKTGLDIEIIPMHKYLPHPKMLDLHAQARAYVGLSISDGISTSMLEVMALGAFPIQTCTSCANEWVKDGETGFILDSYDDEKKLGELMLKALKDDALVDSAAEINWETIQSKAKYEDVKKIARSFYDEAYASKTR